MSIRAAMENPEPIEPTMASTPDGLYCLAHGTMECQEPWCWRCGNHLMDDFERCADPKCRATNDPTARAEVERIKGLFPDRPAPIEVISAAIALAYPFPSLPGEPGGGDIPEPSAPATGAAG